MSLVQQGCGLDTWSGHIHETINEWKINGTISQSLFLALSLSNKFKKKINGCSQSICDLQNLRLPPFLDIAPWVFPRDLIPRPSLPISAFSLNNDVSQEKLLALGNSFYIATTSEIKLLLHNTPR